MSSKENKNLVKQLKKGDKKAFDVFYWSYRKPVYNLALNYLKDSELAEDAVQDVFLKLWSKRENLSDEKSVRGLLFSSLKNHVLNMIKINKRRIIRQFEYIHRNPEIEQNPEEDACYSELEQILNDGLEQLPVGKQTVYRMKKIEGYSNKEVAEQLNISVHTVKSQYYKANDFLRKYVKTNL